MKEGLTRREFLKIAGVSTAGATLGTGIFKFLEEDINELKKLRYFPDVGFYLDSDHQNFSYFEAEGMAKQLDHLFDSFEDEQTIQTDQKALEEWSMELLPLFSYEGATLKDSRIPKEVSFALSKNGNSFVHIAGQSDCINFVRLNGRFTNPVSTRYGELRFVSVLAHELAHVQSDGICQIVDRDKIENTAQIVSWEVLAALANMRNKIAAFALIDELRSTAINIAWAKSIVEGKTHRFENFRKKLSPGAVSEAAFDKTTRRWKNDLEELSNLILIYSEEPLIQVLQAILKDDCRLKDLALITPEFYVDDLAYFLAHKEQIIADFNQNY